MMLCLLLIPILAECYEHSIWAVNIAQGSVLQGVEGFIERFAVGVFAAFAVPVPTCGAVSEHFLVPGKGRL